MTLILCAANDEQVILVSDRRLTFNGQITEEEWNKSASLVLRDARLAVAFTGIAVAGTFNTRRWLAEAIMKSAAPDYSLESTLVRLRDRATRDFKKFKLADPMRKRLSLVLAGYSYSVDARRCSCYLISNFQRFEDYRVKDVLKSDEFMLSWIREVSPSTDPIALIALAGFDKGVSEAETARLFDVLKKRKPAQALTEKAVDIVQEAARSSRSKGLVGQQCTSITLPSDPAAEATSRYHSATITETIFATSHIDARGGGSGVFVIDSPEIRYPDNAGNPTIAAVPKVGANWPCPCRSGRKYKKCHGVRAHL